MGDKINILPPPHEIILCGGSFVEIYCVGAVLWFGMLKIRTAYDKLLYFFDYFHLKLTH